MFASVIPPVLCAFNPLPRSVATLFSRGPKAPIESSDMAMSLVTVLMSEKTTLSVTIVLHKQLFDGIVMREDYQ